MSDANDYKKAVAPARKLVLKLEAQPKPQNINKNIISYPAPSNYISSLVLPLKSFPIKADILRKAII